jgi:hypothetical protein
MAHASLSVADLGSKVVRLPTAAKRRPENNRYAAQREAKKALKEAQGIHFPHKSWWQRQEERRKEKLRQFGVERTPEMCVAIAIFEALPEDVRRKIKMALLAVSAVDLGNGAQGASLLLNGMSGHDAG